MQSSDTEHALEEVRRARLAGQSVVAFERLIALLREKPQTGLAWPELASVARDCGRVEEAMAECIRAYEADRELHPALKALLHLMPDELRATAAIRRRATKRFPISIIVCSNDDTGFAAMVASYRSALAGWPHEVVRIRKASSLAEGYTRGAAAATGQVVIFTHDDVELLAADFGDRLADHLAECDILGVAGATRATGPTWSFAGWPFLHGLIIYPQGAGYRVAVYSKTVPLACGIRVMDGVFLAMRRDIALAVGWDMETCDGFHGYDVDFTLRAAQRGLRLAVASDLGLVHRSYGSFDENWVAAARKLIARHAELNQGRTGTTGPVARDVPSARHAMALVDNWAELGAARVRA